MKTKLLTAISIILITMFPTVHAAEYEQIVGGPVQAHTQKNGDNVYTIFKFSLSGGITKSNSTNKAFAAGITSTSECVGYSKTEKGISSVESHCHTIDSEGTTLYGRSTRVGAIGQTSDGKQFIEVLTGNSTGMKSECAFVPKYSKTSEGTYLIVISKCTTAQ